MLSVNCLNINHLIQQLNSSLVFISRVSRICFSERVLFVSIASEEVNGGRKSWENVPNLTKSEFALHVF